MGIEPTYSAWKAEVLPLNYTRNLATPPACTQSTMVEGGGFEPPKVEPADLQSAPFGRSGTPPKSSRVYCLSATQLSTVTHVTADKKTGAGDRS